MPLLLPTPARIVNKTNPQLMILSIHIFLGEIIKMVVRASLVSITNEEKFWGMVKKTDSCWIWTGTQTKDGYGRFWQKAKKKLVHRISFESLKNIIPKGLEIDHLCRNRICVNPDHMECVTHAENMKRSHPNNSQKTHCPQGHPYDEKNTKIVIGGNGNKWRHCRICGRIERRERRLKNRGIFI